ncbi:MAG: DUF599 domain-containing protein [Hyphomicrobiaceae bacterium]|nr:DUF599 domain-containing protein [Hyphomicrobiaceae bacterium]
MVPGNVPPLDIAAASLFLLCWVGYGLLAQSFIGKHTSLLSVMRVFRKRWIERMTERDNHIGDAALLSNLLRGALFFASTTVFILGGLVALLGTAPKVAEVISQLPLAGPAETGLAEIKSLVLIIVYVYAFFKFTWSAWQYNVLSILVGGMPDADADPIEREGFAIMASRVMWLAGESYNNGIRAYYFSIPLMAWFIDPILCIGTTLIVTIVMYRREYHSSMLQALKDELG